jgi:hypothetical protein
MVCATDIFFLAHFMTSILIVVVGLLLLDVGIFASVCVMDKGAEMCTTRSV